MRIKDRIRQRRQLRESAEQRIELNKLKKELVEARRQAVRLIHNALTHYLLDTLRV
jgi:hypothetical protein